MSDSTDDELAELERQSAALEAELARVGITWDALRAELAPFAAALPAPGRNDARRLVQLFVFGPAIAALRQLPDGAGVAPFVAWIRQSPTWRALWEHGAPGA